MPGHHHFTFRHLPVIERLRGSRESGLSARSGADEGGDVLKVVAATLVGGLAALVPVGSLAAPAAPTLVVKVYDLTGVSEVEMARARETMRAILGLAGVNAVWRDCAAIERSDRASTVCAHPRAPEELVIRIVAAGPNAVADVLGFSAVDVRQASPSLATVLADRVGLIAAQTQADRGHLLGLVIAHEIGHLLLGSNGHGDSGLMRPHWNGEELRRDQPTDWVFSRAEARRLRLAATARSSGPESSLRLSADEDAVDLSTSTARHRPRSDAPQSARRSSTPGTSSLSDPAGPRLDASEP